MRRRQFIRLLAGAALAPPQALRAQQIERVSRVGVLIPYLETDTEAQAQMAAFRDGLEKLGLAPGRSVQIDERWTAGDFGMLRRAAKELVALRPDVIISRSSGLASEPDGALIVTPDLTTTLYRGTIIKTTMRYRVPAMFPFRYVAAEGGLIFYGVDIADQYRQAADYVDRILKGAKPRELPVQAPTRFELAINLKTAKALGLTASPSLLARANEVIE